MITDKREIQKIANLAMQFDALTGGFRLGESQVEPLARTLIEESPDCATAERCISDIVGNFNQVPKPSDIRIWLQSDRRFRERRACWRCQGTGWIDIPKRAVRVGNRTMVVGAVDRCPECKK